MKNFCLNESTFLSRDVIFKISTDVSNFHKIMPDYFKSLKIIDDTLPNQKIVLENISFLGRNIDVKTKHVIMQPDTHKVFILSGPLRGTAFIEKYNVSKSNGSDITITVNLSMHGLLRFIPFLDRIISKKMKSVMLEFVRSSENYFNSTMKD